MSLFRHIAACLGPDEQVSFQLRCDGAQLTVLVLPQLKASSPTDPDTHALRTALAYPLIVRGTADDLDQSLWATLTTYASQRHALHASDQDLTALAAVVQQTQQTVERRRAGAAVGGGAGAPPPSAPPAAPPPVAFETTNPDSLF
jgi:PRTRC genetic system protein E